MPDDGIASWVERWSIVSGSPLSVRSVLKKQRTPRNASSLNRMRDNWLQVAKGLQALEDNEKLGAG